MFLSGPRSQLEHNRPIRQRGLRREINSPMGATTQLGQQPVVAQVVSESRERRLGRHGFKEVVTLNQYLQLLAPLRKPAQHVVGGSVVPQVFAQAKLLIN